MQDAVWSFDRKARAWYMHRFYEHQADLNIANPAVREEILKIMGFWLQLGVSGFRIDAVPFLIEYKGLKEAPDRDPLLLLSEMRDFLDWREAERDHAGRGERRARADAGLLRRTQSTTPTSGCTCCSTFR